MCNMVVLKPNHIDDHITSKWYNTPEMLRLDKKRTSDSVLFTRNHFKYEDTGLKGKRRRDIYHANT